MEIKITKDPYDYQRFLICVNKLHDLPSPDIDPNKVVHELRRITKIHFFLTDEVHDKFRITTPKIKNRRVRKGWMNKVVNIEI